MYYYPRPIYFYRAPFRWFRPATFVKGPAEIKQSLAVNISATGGSNVNVNVNQIIGGINRPVPRYF